MRHYKECKPKCNPCQKQENTYYCGKDIDCLKIKKGDKTDEVLNSVGHIICDIKNRIDLFASRRIELEENPNCNGGVVIKLINANTEEVVEQYDICDDFQIEVEENSACPNGGFVINDITGETPVEIYQGCYTNIEVEETPGGFSVKQNGRTIFEGQYTEITAEDKTDCDNGGIKLYKNGVKIYETCYPKAAHQNTLFVDKKYGDDSEGIRENYLKPYKTIQEAIDNATVGDTVHVRTGTFNENIILKDKVDLYFEDVVFKGTIKDGVTAVESTLRGGLTLDSTTANTIEVVNPGSNITFNIEKIKSTNTLISMEGGTLQNPNRIYLECKSIEGLKVNYYFRLLNNSFLTVKSKEEITSDRSYSGQYHATLHTKFNFTGRVVVESPYIFINDVDDGLEGNMLLWEETDSSGEVCIESKKIENISSPVGGAGTSYSTIRLGGGNKTCVRANNILSKNMPVLGVTENSDSGEVYITGNLKTETAPVVVLRGDNKVLIEHSKIERDSSGYAVGIFSKPAGEKNIRLKDCYVTSKTDEVNNLGAIYIENTDDLTKQMCFLEDTDIYVEANNSISATTPTNIYAKNITADQDKGSNVTDIATPTGFTVDSNLPKI